MALQETVAPATFSLARMTELAEWCALDGDKVPTEEFCDLIEYIILLLQGIGPLMSVTFADVAEKSVIMKCNKAFMIRQFGKSEDLTLNEIIDEEIAKGVIRLNSENNSSECDKSKRNSWEWTYNSSGRNLVRMWWLTKFITKLLDNLVNRAEMSLVAACKDAYTTGFSNHHPWLVRSGAEQAMNAAGNKASLLAKWGCTDIEEARPCLEHFEQLRDNLYNLLNSRSLLNLP